jgi:hypothetical protein
MLTLVAAAFSVAIACSFSPHRAALSSNAAKRAALFPA